MLTSALTRFHRPQFSSRSLCILPRKVMTSVPPTPNASNVLVVNGEVCRTMLNSKEFVTTCPRGAYTSGRTVDQVNVFQLSMHAVRLANTVKEMSEMDATLGHPPPRFTDASWVKQQLKQDVKAALLFAGVASEDGVVLDAGCEWKLSVVLSWQADTPHGSVHVHLSHLHDRPPGQAVTVLVAEFEREHATAKDTKWAVDRASIEPAVYGAEFCADETVMMTSTGQLLEGTQTNFGVFVNGALVTPAESILLGTVRQVVLDAAEIEDVPVELRPPHITEVLATLSTHPVVMPIQSAFICSTSRLMLPICRIAMPTLLFRLYADSVGTISPERLDESHPGWVVIQLDPCEAVCARMVARTKSLIASHSESVFS